MQVLQDFHARLLCESHAPKCVVDSISGLQSQIFCAFTLADIHSRAFGFEKQDKTSHIFSLL